MRRRSSVRFVVLLAAACGSKAAKPADQAPTTPASTAPSPVSAAPAVTPASAAPVATPPPAAAAAAVLAAPLVQCERVLAAIDALMACDAAMGPALESARRFLADQGDAKALAEMFPDEVARTYATRESGAACATMLVMTAKDPPATTCRWAEAAVLADARSYLIAYDGARAPLEPTGDAARDASLAKLAGLRDEMCACATPTCAREVDARVLAAPRPPSGTPATPAARRVLDGLAHDLKKCSAETRFLNLIAP